MSEIAAWLSPRGAALLLLIACSMRAALADTTTAAPLNYTIDKTVVKNPWLILAASKWPSMALDDVRHLAVPAPVGERDHFATWVQGTIDRHWWPDGFASVPFLANTGFVLVKQDPTYRVRVREETLPAYEGSDINTKALVMAVEPLTGPIAVPRTGNDLWLLLRQFLDPGLGAFLSSAELFTAADEYVTPPFVEQLPGSMFLALWPRKARLPVQLYAWTDGKIVITALYEDVQYKSPEAVAPFSETGPPPPASVKTAP